MVTTTKAGNETRPWRRALLWGLGLTLVARLVALGLGLMLWQTDQVPAGPDYTTLSDLDPEPVMGELSGWTTGVWLRHDTLLYVEVAEHGYERRDSAIVFPPAYPLAIRALGWLTGGNLLVAALLVSTIATALALAALYRLTEDLLDEDAARWATAYQLIFPTGYILLAAYAEPMMLLLTVLTFDLARRHRFGAGRRGGLPRHPDASAIGDLVRPSDRDRLEEVRFGKDWWRRSDTLWSVAAGPLAALGYQIYLVAAGLPRVDDVYRQVWRSVPTVPGAEIWLAIQDLFTGPTTIGRKLALILFFAAVGLTVLAFRKLPPSRARTWPP